ncbi:MAG: hypothetical protein PHH28_06305 [Desulfuromonadaceae bacterium]|nr:hypothetical protein [Desulfuromonadaceae bacterium]
MGIVLLSEDENMGNQLKAEETVTLEELALSNSFEIAALVSVLEQKGILTKAEVIAEIGRLRGQVNT